MARAVKSNIRGCCGGIKGLTLNLFRNLVVIDQNLKILGDVVDVVLQEGYTAWPVVATTSRLAGRAAIVAGARLLLGVLQCPVHHFLTCKQGCGSWGTHSAAISLLLSRISTILLP